jgi:hypothetical protein
MSKSGFAGEAIEKCKEEVRWKENTRKVTKG